MEDIESDYHINKKKDFRLIMIHFGFDFSLLGSIYLYEMLLEISSGNSFIKGIEIPQITKLAEKHNVKMKTYSRNIRWAIKKAYNDGMLKYIPFFENRTNAPTTKQVLAWLYHYYLFNE